jgi:hypothetical protein
MNDTEFLAYCSLHCRTEAALFMRDDVVRIYELAGYPMRGDLPAEMVVRPAIMNELVETAQARLSVKHREGTTST